MLLQRGILILLACLLWVNGSAQTTTIYQWDWKKEGFWLGASGLLWGGGFWLKNQRDEATILGIEQLNRNDIWAFDRGATSQFSNGSATVSDYLVYGSFAVALTHYIPKKGRNEGWAIGGMLVQAYLINDGITNVIKGMAQRYRPFAYNPEVEIDTKLSSSSRSSFPSGHTSGTAMATFFTAKVYSDLYPDSKWKPLVWSVAAILPAATGYFRYQAGKHFPTDVIAGYALGAIVGVGIPHLHRRANPSLSLRMYPIGQGMVFNLQKRF
ncbi:MAG: phosphatase PAP2 family protein [Bacteroidota bacterium]